MFQSGWVVIPFVQNSLQACVLINAMPDDSVFFGVVLFQKTDTIPIV